MTTRPAETTVKVPVLPVAGIRPVAVTLHTPDAFARAIQCASHAPTLVPGVMAIGAEATLHLVNMLLVSVQLRHLLSIQPAALPFLPYTRVLSGLTATDGVLKLARTHPVLHGCGSLLVRPVAAALVLRLCRFDGAQRQGGNHCKSNTDVSHRWLLLVRDF